ncbi:MAG: SDR family oxidoreductase, partial [Polaromonas sp.]|nr:SDR family oxidoreductase [Polaromonas sp.]
MTNDSLGAVRECIAVTGASRGIGAAIARALAEAGHHVACLSRSGGVPVADAQPEVAARCFAVTVDVMQTAGVRDTLRRLAATGWRIKGLVNNAGMHATAPSAELPLDQWHQVMDMNATSVVTACQAVYPHLVAGGGVIVNIGSFFDKLGVKQNLAYCASKAAVGAITRCLAVEWAGKGIRVINVAPGYIVTDLNADPMAPGGPLRAYLEKRIPGREPGTAAAVGALVA